MEKQLNNFMQLISSKSKSTIYELGKSIYAILFALGIGALIIILMGENPLIAYLELYKGAFANPLAITNTLSRVTPLVFCGLSVAIAMRAGMFNIGAEGQLYFGALVSILFMLTFPNLPKAVLLTIGILSGMLAGAAWATIPGFFKARMGINEVIVGIMCNYIMTLFVSYLVNNPFKEPGSHNAQTIQITENARLSKLIFSNSQLNNGFIIAIVVSVIVYILLFKTTIGYKFRSVGMNADAARAGGISPEKITILSMALAGAIAALAGITEVLGKYHRFIDGFSPGFGFTGIAVAILGRTNPAGILLTSLLFGILNAGSLRMSRVTGISSDLVMVIQALVVFFVAAPELFKSIGITLKRSGGKNV